MSLRRDSNLGELNIQGVQDEIAQKNSKGKLPTKSILRQIVSKSASTPVKMEQLQLWENLKIRILIWKKVQFEDLNQIMKKSWQKLSDNQESWRKLFLNKKRASIDAWDYWSNGSRLPQGIVSFHYLFPDKKTSYTAYHINYLLTFFKF